MLRGGQLATSSRRTGKSGPIPFWKSSNVSHVSGPIYTNLEGLKQSQKRLRRPSGASGSSDSEQFTHYPPDVF
jgi:hypothetical protein